MSTKSRVAAAVAILALLSPVAAQSDAGVETAIRDALSTWTADFNARDASRICDLFAPDLRYDFRGTPERDYNAMCSALHRALGDRSKTLTYILRTRRPNVPGETPHARARFSHQVEPLAVQLDGKTL